MSKKLTFKPHKDNPRPIPEGHLPAIPPNDYSGSIADWTIALITRGLMKEDQFYGDVILTKECYEEILTECES